MDPHSNGLNVNVPLALPGDKLVTVNFFFFFQEPHTNGPLFTELAFYQRVAKPDLSM